MKRYSFVRTFWCAALLVGLPSTAFAQAEPRPAAEPTPLPGTKPLTLEGDIASQLVDGVDRFLLAEIEKSIGRRSAFWNRDLSSPEKYNASIAPNRRRLAHILGVRDARVEFDAVELIATTGRPALAGRGDGFKAFAVRWPAVDGIDAEGLLLVPEGREPIADVVAIPDAAQSPEQIAGLADGVPPRSQFARRLARSGCRVLVPAVISRQTGQYVPDGGRQHGLTNREFLYRSAFELGRHPIGFEVQKVLAAVDWFEKEAAGESAIGVVGYGEGGLAALYAAALDTRIDAACVSGYFDSRQNIWQEPIDRNVFGLLEQFGDAELAAMIAPRSLVVEAAAGPTLELPPGTRGAPARLVSPRLETVRAELDRARALTPNFDSAHLEVSGRGDGPFGGENALARFAKALNGSAAIAPLGNAPENLRVDFDPAERTIRQMRQIDRFDQRLLLESPYVRAEFTKKLDTSSLAKYAESVEPYRTFFAEEVIGRFDDELLPPNVRSRKVYETDKWTGYEVVLDVYTDVIAYGLLLLPNDLEPGGRRPVVVCQHGLEGRPQDVIGAQKFAAYKAFAAQLAERGFIVFAPQNLYIFGDRFRTLQRKANPIKKTLFSVIVPQHKQIVGWLATLPNVDAERIAFYGLSYGGKSAMRIPPLVPEYCLSICSADFNEWVWKNASTRGRYSYVFTGEYEIFEFDLGSTFNYAEMAALIAPRPFMVERGHFDGVAPDETVGYEFAKVRHLYQARLGIGERCRIEWFVGPHTINGQGTFEMLHEALNWPKK